MKRTYGDSPNTRKNFNRKKTGRPESLHIVLEGSHSPDEIWQMLGEGIAEMKERPHDEYKNIHFYATPVMPEGKKSNCETITIKDVYSCAADEHDV